MKLQLFKYFAPKYDDRWNMAFYEKRAIFFQKPINFNDPWDCKVSNIKIPRQQNFLKQFFFYICKQHADIAFANEEWERMKGQPRSEIKTKLKQSFEKAMEYIRDSIGVFSASCVPDSELMWSHYGKSHKGYVLHFEIDLLEFLNSTIVRQTGIPIPVIYTNKRQIWDLASYYNNREEHLYDLIRYKSNAWKYEYEIRLLNQAQNGFIKIPDTWLKSIIVGFAAETELRSLLFSASKELGIPIYYAQMDKSEYKVNISGLGIDRRSGEQHYQEVISAIQLTLS
jgi:DUF2971 family protein